MFNGITIVFLCVVYCIFFTSKAHAVTNPTDPVQTLHDIQKAIDTADQEAFDKAVDVESLAGQCVDIFLDNTENMDKKSMPTMLAVMLSAVKKSDAAKQKLRNTLITEAAAFIRYGVHSGAFGGKKATSKAPKGLLSAFFTDTSMARKKITHTETPIFEDNAVYISLLLKDYGTNKEYPVEVCLREHSHKWRVVALRNVHELMNNL